jgi:hypothetical protein
MKRPYLEDDNLGWEILLAVIENSENNNLGRFIIRRLK